MSSSNPRRGIIALSRQPAPLMNAVRGEHETRERVCEVQREETTNEVGKGSELGNGHGDYKSDNPVHRAETPPEVLPALGSDGWQVEDFLADFDVDGFHADVEVEEHREPAGDETQDVADYLETEGFHGLGDGDVGVLPVEAVDLDGMLVLSRRGRADLRRRRRRCRRWK